MNGYDSSVVFHPSCVNRTLTSPPSPACTSKEIWVPIHSGGPVRHLHATLVSGLSSVTSKSNVTGASGKETFIVDPTPSGPSVWLLHHAFTPALVATAS